MDEIAYENGGQDEELIGKADALYKQRLQKSRYIVWDIGLLLSINKTVRGGKFHIYWLLQHVVDALISHLKCRFVQHVMDIKKPESVLQQKRGKLTTFMSKFCWAYDVGNT